MALTQLSSKLTDLLIYAIIIAVAVVAAFFYGGVRYNKGRSDAIAVVAAAPRETTWIPYAIPAPDPVVLRDTIGVPRDTCTGLHTSHAPDSTTSIDGFVSEDEQPVTRERWVQTFPLSDGKGARVGGSIALWPAPGNKVVYELTVDTLHLDHPWILSKTVLPGKTESWWVKPAVAVASIATVALVHEKKYWWAAGTAVAGTSLIVFRWEF